MFDFLKRALADRIVRRRATDLLSSERFITWPPVSTIEETRDLCTRVSWLLPVPAGTGQVLVPARGMAGTENMRLRIPIEVSSDPARAKAAIAGGSTVLLWRIGARSLADLMPALKRCVLIDSTWHGSTEASEWYRLYLAMGTTPVTTPLSAESAAHLNQFLDRYTGAAEVNVCGTGPSVNGILDREAGSAVNMICNAGILSRTLAGHLRPAAIALLNPLYFSPAAQARQVIGEARAAVERYGSCVVTPEGYLHFLMAENYPDIRSHLIGLTPSREVMLPARHTPRTYRTNNVVTTLMLPLAAALRPRRILIWGCDGKAPDSQKKWRYAADQTAARASKEHAAYSEFLDAMGASRRYYELHCERMQKIVEHIEAIGIEVVCAAPSLIPALAARFRGRAPSAPGARIDRQVGSL